MRDECRVKQLQDHLANRTCSPEAFATLWNGVKRSVALAVSAALPALRDANSMAGATQVLDLCLHVCLSSEHER